MLFLLSIAAPPALAQDNDADTDLRVLRPADTMSPRDTLRSFLTNAEILATRWGGVGVGLIEGYNAHRGAIETLNLSDAAYGGAWWQLSERIALLKEILDRLELPPWDQIPGVSAVDADGITRWTVPNSRITIARVETGPRQGEFLFTPDTVARLEYYYRKVKNLPYRPGATPGLYEAWRASPGSTRARQAVFRNRLQGLETSSPRVTLEGFLRIVNRAYRLIMEADAALRAEPPAMTVEQAREVEQEAANLLTRATDALDLSHVPAAHRQDVALETALLLKKVLDRVMLPPIESIPDAGMAAAARERSGGQGQPFHWRLPETKIEIVEIMEGDRAGEFLFSATSLDRIDETYEQVRDLPYRRALSKLLRLEYEDVEPSEGFYEFYISTPGYLLPGTSALGRLVDGLPDGLKRLHGGQTLWQWIGLGLCLPLLLAAAWLIFRTIRRIALPMRPVAAHWSLVLSPLIFAGLVVVVTEFIDRDLNFTGEILSAVRAASHMVVLAMIAWAVLKAVNAAAETVIAGTRIVERGFDAALLRILARLLGLVAGIWIVFDGLQSLGADIVPLLAGLGVGGLAMALAVRPTLENLLGGMILYFDKPVRVGDFCSFGDRTGTVETIGVRSTQIRGLDRTLISVPNATFADMEIVNWAQCDRMLINATLGLRYETRPDQLRNVTAKMREMFHAHPKIDSDTVRVRFSGYGASSLDVTIRVYALTNDWNDFHAIREDVFLRVYDIVAASGTGFAFPSQTLYLGRDDGLDAELGDAAVAEVGAWRRDGRLPFPRLSEARMNELEGSLDYPPEGSVDAHRTGERAWDAPERLAGEETAQDAQQDKDDTP